jgi:outer membrane protein TolC
MISARHSSVWALAAALAAAPALVRAQSPPLSLEMAVTEALQHSPVLAPRYDALSEAGIERRLAGAAFGVKVTPTVSTGTDPYVGPTRMAGVSVSKMLSTGGQVFVNASSYTAGQPGASLRDSEYTVGVSQPLLRGFSRTATAGVVSADRARVGAERVLAVARAALVVQVTRQYYAVVKGQRLVAAARDASDRAVALETASEARTRVGLATELDVLRAQVQRSQVAAALASATGALAAARDDLSLTLGRPLGTPFDLDLDEAASSRRAEGAAVLPDDVNELVRMALATRLDVAEARDRIADAGRTTDVARLNLRPPVSFDVSYTQRGLALANATSLPGLTGLTGGWHVGLNTTYSLDNASQSAAAASAQVAAGTAAHTARDTEEHAAGDVRQAYRVWQTAIATVAIERQTVSLAERELALAQLRLDRGLGDTLDVVGAQNSLLQAQNALIAAELDQTVLALDLRRAVGLLETSEAR